MKPAPILAIDTSCDDTSAAVTAGATVLSNIIASQTQLHAPYGGVFPTVAKQAHRENIDQATEVALQRAKVSWSHIKAIAVTQGPGLAPALEVGIEKAKQLATEQQLPLIAVNHIQAHALSPLAQPRRRYQPQKFVSLTAAGAQHTLPVLSLVVSGGHTELIKITQLGHFQRLGASIDDAAGEALDKVGRMLDLGYPAGSIIEKFARKGDEQKYQLPLPMTDREDFNMSFSGLKTWARNKLEEMKAHHPLSKAEIYDFTASFQYGIFRHICYKLSKLLKREAVKEIWLGGGVAANIRLRRMIRETLRAYSRETQTPLIKLFTPYSQRLCMDNAAMVGVAAAWQFQQQKTVKNFSQLARKPRWQVDDQRS